ncbi:MAG: ATP-dependent RNA helicase [Candidatus Saccharibacteria bacterium]|nr:MAG: ATP-dependent RNA helicase [Candidatus Saccharibacteria bacterium]
MNATELGFAADLPIFDYHEAITSAVDANQVTIITAETGAGKSTQVPQYLAEHGYSKVIVTQPRILAARNLSRRVREERAMRTGVDSDELIGYRTAHERDDGPDTQILYCTDGLQLVREITGSGTSEKQVLVLDEIHEWNENMEVLVAWAKKRCQEEPRFKVVIMSATIESENLGAYFGTTSIIAVPGRSYEVVKRRGKDLIAEIMQLLDTKTSNMLVFLPGKAEIENVGEAIKKKALAKGVPVIPLHSQLEASAQQQAFASYPKGKVILSTNIAQTSVTIDDIDVVIDSGLERRSEVQNGVEGLFIAQISQADSLQRAGRAGRTKNGEYILAPYDTMPCLAFEDRPPYGTPEILRKHIDRLTLRLANVGIDIELLDFYHAPSHRALKNAKRTLVALGALTQSGEVTATGRRMERFPVESAFARMLVEAEMYSQEVQAKLAAIISIQEVGGIVKSSTRYTAWRSFTRQTKSDLLAQYDVYLAIPTIDPEQFEDMGIIGKNVIKAQETMERLDRDLGFDPSKLTPIESHEVEPLLKCIVAGQIDQLWTVEPDGTVIHLSNNQKRELSSGTVVAHPKLIAGTPFDLQIPTPKGDLETLHLVQGVTAVNPAWLEGLVPHLFTSKPGKIYYDNDQGALVMRQVVKFNGRTVEGAGVPITDSNPRTRRMFADLYGAWLYERLERERRNLRKSHNRRIPAVLLRQLQKQVRTITGGAISLGELSRQQRAELESLGKMQTHLGDAFMAKLGTSRKGGDRSGQQRRGWEPRHKRKYDRRNDYR